MNVPVCLQTSKVLFPAFYVILVYVYGNNILCVTCTVCVIVVYIDLLQRVSIPCFEVVSGNDRVIEYHDEMVQVS